MLLFASTTFRSSHRPILPLRRPEATSYFMEFLQSLSKYRLAIKLSIADMVIIRAVNIEDAMEALSLYNKAIQELYIQQIKRLISPNLLLPMQMECEPEFCRDVLETRVKQVFREALRISRDIPFTQVCE